jgi:hypothetical protein
VIVGRAGRLRRYEGVAILEADLVLGMTPADLGNAFGDLFVGSN